MDEIYFLCILFVQVNKLFDVTVITLHLAASAPV